VERGDRRCGIRVGEQLVQAALEGIGGLGGEPVEVAGHPAGLTLEAEQASGRVSVPKTSTARSVMAAP